MPGYRTGDSRPHRRARPATRGSAELRARGGRARGGDPGRRRAAERRAPRRPPAQHRGRRRGWSSSNPALRAAGRDPPFPGRAPPRPPGRVRAGPRRLLPGGARPLRRAGSPAPAAQDPLRPLLSRGPAEAHVRGGHQRAVRAQAGRHPVLRQPVRRRQGGGRDLPHRPGPLLPGRDPERPLRLPHPRRGTASPSTPTRPWRWTTSCRWGCKACNCLEPPLGTRIFQLHDPSTRLPRPRRHHPGPSGGAGGDAARTSPTRPSGTPPAPTDSAGPPGPVSSRPGARSPRRSAPSRTR